MEEYVKLEFELESGTDDSRDLEAYVESQLLIRAPAEKRIAHEGPKQILIYDFTEIDEAALDDFFEVARGAGVAELVVNAVSRSAGERLFANPGGGVELFVSREELEAARGIPDGEELEAARGIPEGGALEAARGIPEGEALEAVRGIPDEAPMTFDFGGRGDANTLLVRLHVARGERKSEIVEMFRPLEDFRTPKLITAFEEQFASYTSESGERPVKWPAYYGGDGQWHFGPDNILDGFMFVAENGEYVYLCFDMTNINRDQASMENFVGVFRPAFFGTHRVWAKLRTVSGEKEKFYFEAGEGIQSVLRARTEDSDWKNPM